MQTMVHLTSNDNLNMVFRARFGKEPFYFFASDRKEALLLTPPPPKALKPNFDQDVCYMLPWARVKWTKESAFPT